MSQISVSVSSLNIKIKSLLEATFLHTLVEGEVASVTYHTSGHLYFSLKDEKSTIKCIMWRSSVKKMKFQIEKGMHLVVEGSVSVYTPRGEYQFQAVQIEPYGKGTLALAFEQLKERLKAKGYFDKAQKKPIPKEIRRMALVTGKESAALYDMLTVIKKRWPLIEVSVVDTLVQGEEASKQIVKALRYADSLGVDVVVMGRGGGSVESLWCFNEEVVAHAIFAMKTPLVSAVGHEVDVMISDYVADLRAPTPSAAIEMILPNVNEVSSMLIEHETRFKALLSSKLLEAENLLKESEVMLQHTSPLRKLERFKREFQRIEEEFQRIISYKMNSFEALLPKWKESLKYALSFTLEQKQQQCTFFEQKVKLSNPSLSSRAGWTQVSQGGKRVSLTNLEREKPFILEDGETKIEAICLYR